MKIDPETVHKIAHLARLELTEAEQSAMLGDMNKILAFMDKLNEIDTSTVEPLIYMTDEVNVLRKDVEAPCISTEEALQNAPDQEGNYFRVARVIPEQPL